MHEIHPIIKGYLSNLSLFLISQISLSLIHGASYLTFCFFKMFFVPVLLTDFK